MRKGFIAATFAGLILLASLSGCAVDPESRMHVTAMATYIDDDLDRNVDDNLSGYHIGVGKSLGDNYKVEMTAVGSRMNADTFDADQRQVGLGLDVMRKLGSSAYFYPYAVLGVGLLRTERLGPDGRDSNGPMYSIGAGVITPFYVMGQAVRVELRHRNDSGGSAGENYQDSLLSIGLHFPLGRPATFKPDSDGDGVDDARDKCEGTRAGAPVDKYGCARDLDSDNDGVSDAIDMCGGTQAGKAVDEYGCERTGDSDADGVPDYRDRCPDSRAGARVDADGCPVNATTDTPGDSSITLPVSRSAAGQWPALETPDWRITPNPDSTTISSFSAELLLTGPASNSAVDSPAFSMSYTLSGVRQFLDSGQPQEQNARL